MIYLGTSFKNSVSYKEFLGCVIRYWLLAFDLAKTTPFLESKGATLHLDTKPKRIYNSHYGNGVPAMFTLRCWKVNIAEKHHYRNEIVDMLGPNNRNQKKRILRKVRNQKYFHHRTCWKGPSNPELIWKAGKKISFSEKSGSKGCENTIK